MSIGYVPKNELTAQRALSAQELAVRGLDYALYMTAAGGSGADPYLGVAGTYSILASSAITNTGSSVITGNVGLNPGSSITPGGWTVTGTINVDNSAAMTANAAAASGYSALSALATTATISNVLDGQTLVPGVYAFGAGDVHLATSGNASMTFNGAGTYVFKVPSTLHTGAGGIPTMNLTNGATAAKIYWLVGSSATLNVSASGVFQGNVLAETAITLDGGSANGTMAALGTALTISAATNITAVSFGETSLDILIYIREPIEAVYLADLKVDASDLQYPYNQASISIVDSAWTLANQNPLSGYNEFGLEVSDQGAILLTGYPGSAFNPYDMITVTYKTATHL